MRNLIMALFLALPMMAQSAALPAAERTANPESLEAKPADGTPKPVAVVTTPQVVHVCSIPLLDVLPQSAASAQRMPVYRPEHPERFAMKFVRIPAPACAGTAGNNVKPASGKAGGAQP